MNEILKRINEVKHIVVISHVNPDTDSIGSASAFYTHLLRLHKKVSFVCVTKEINQKFAFLPWFEKIRNTFPSSADLAISFDCANKKRIGLEIDCDLINIDHHKSNTKYGDINLVDANSISTTKILYDFFKLNNIVINKKMATALYAGLLDDSDGFLDDRVDGTVFAVIKELIECGADYKTSNKFVKKWISLGAFRLKALMYKNMKLMCDAKVAVFCIDDNDIKSSGAIVQDCQSVLKESLYLPTVKVALLLKINNDFSIKGSLRSNSLVDVSRIASSFDGGGHNDRAGFNIKAGSVVQEVKEKILKLICKEI